MIGTLYTTAFLCTLATGMVGVLIGIHLAKLRYGPAETDTAEEPNS